MNRLADGNATKRLTDELAENDRLAGWKPFSDPTMDYAVLLLFIESVRLAEPVNPVNPAQAQFALEGLGRALDVATENRWRA